MTNSLRIRNKQTQKMKRQHTARACEIERMLLASIGKKKGKCRLKRQLARSQHAFAVQHTINVNYMGIIIFN